MKCVWATSWLICKAYNVSKDRWNDESVIKKNNNNTRNLPECKHDAQSSRQHSVISYNDQRYKYYSFYSWEELKYKLIRLSKNVPSC